MQQAAFLAHQGAINYGLVNGVIEPKLKLALAQFWVDSAALCVEIGQHDEALKQLRYGLSVDNTCLDAYMSIA